MLFKFLGTIMTTATLVVVTEWVLSLTGLSMITTAAIMVALWCCVIGLGAIMWEAAGW